MSARPHAVWLLAGGSMQVPAARYAKAQGYALVLTDRDPECRCRELADHFIPLDTFDLDGHLAALEEVRQRFELAAVFTCGADCHHTVARLAEAAGRPGHPPALSVQCRLKHVSRQRLAEAGLPQPRHCLVSDLDQARAALDRFGGSAVIKATDNSGSRGFAVLPGPEALTADLLQESIAQGTTGQALMEERLRPITHAPAELSVETLWYDGEMHWLNWVDRLFGRDMARFPAVIAERYRDLPDGIEVGHVNPSGHDETLRREIERQVAVAGRALGLDRLQGGTLLKADVMVTRDGPVIIEVTPRLSGGWDSAASTPARGGRFIEGMLDLALGRPLTPALWQARFRFDTEPRYSAVMAQIPDGARNCIGRRCALGQGKDSAAAVMAAYRALEAGRFL